MAPTIPNARDDLAEEKTQGSWRKRSEGLQPQHVKPSKSAKHCRNTDSRTSDLAGVTCRQVTAVYKGVVKKAPPTLWLGCSQAPA